MMRGFLGGMMLALVVVAGYDSAIGIISLGDWLIVVAIVLGCFYLGTRRESDE